MSRALVARAAAIWVAILVLAVANGAVRESVLIPWLGRTMGLVSSGAVLCAVVLLVSGICMPWVRPRSARDSWFVGVLWVGLTVAFEFGFGAVVQHRTWHDMVQPYLFRDGNIWPVVLAVILVAPRLGYGLIAHPSADRSSDS